LLVLTSFYHVSFFAAGVKQRGKYVKEKNNIISHSYTSYWLKLWPNLSKTV